MRCLSRGGVVRLIGLLLVGVGAAACTARPEAASAEDDRIPAFEFDPTWPKTPLPNNWGLGVIGGVHVDAKDIIWVLHRANTRGLGSASDNVAKWGAECCRPAPAVVAFDQAGGIIKAWGGPDPKTPGKTADGYEWPSEHGIFVDRAGNVWIGCEGGATDKVTGPQNCGSITKVTSEGRILWQKGKMGQTKGNGDIENFNSPTGIFVDEDAREAFISDGYRNQRIAVLDADTGAFKRMWGPYGGTPRDLARNQVNGGTTRKHEPEGLKTFGDSVHCIEISRDGLVYVCDRGNNRIQVFKKDGTFVKEAFVAPKTGGNGSVFDIAFSPDPEQRFMYVGDGNNRKVHILRREDMVELGSFGQAGLNAGELGGVHAMASDSRGHLYIGETATINRIQRFKYVGMRKRQP